MLTVIFAITFYLGSTILRQWFDPRFDEQQTRLELVEMQQSVDSLGLELQHRDQYILNIKRILSGEEEEEQVQQEPAASMPQPQNDENLALVDSVFKSEFERGGDFLLGALEENVELRQIYFFAPLAGYISEPFNPIDDHFGIDIVAKKDEPVKCIADGTVVFASWTQNEGNVIAIQHQQNLVSIYKHNSSLTKAVGDFVSAGEIVAIIGNTGELTSGPHLHFELWYNGAAVNPEEFISF
nr:M23 family metallopeptidase [Roseivirga pacifica]